MANISKFKDKKTGEVYDLGPKTWEITLTEEDFTEEEGQMQLEISGDLAEAISKNVKEKDVISFILDAGDFGTYKYAFPVSVLIGAVGVQSVVVGYAGDGFCMLSLNEVDDAYVGTAFVQVPSFAG